MVVAGVMPTTYAVMGIVGQPLLFVILGIVMALFSVGYAEMSRHVHNAGAFYAYIARGLGGTVGAGASFVALAAYSALQVGIYGIFGFEVASLLDRHLSLHLAWWVPALLGVLLTGALGALKIDLNAKVLGVLLVIEVALIVVFDIAFAAEPGPQGLSLHAFDPATLGGAGPGHRAVLRRRRLRRLRTGPRLRRGDQPPADRRGPGDVPRRRLRRGLLRPQLLADRRRHRPRQGRRRRRGRGPRADLRPHRPAPGHHLHRHRCTSSS